MFVDETWAKTEMTRLRGWSTAGQRLVAKVPFRHWKTMTFIAGLRCDGLCAPLRVRYADQRAKLLRLDRAVPRSNPEA